MFSLVSLINIEIILNPNLNLIFGPMFLVLVWSWTESLGRTMDIIVTVLSLWFLPVVISITELYAHRTGMLTTDLIIVYPGYWIYLVIATIVVIPATLVFKAEKAQNSN